MAGPLRTAHPPSALFLLFGFKQGWSSLFSGLLLLAIVVTRVWWPFETIQRYDFLFVFAVVVQVGLLLLRLETPREALVIVVFHVVATMMELFKTSPSIGSWVYPEPAVIRLGSVPLFAGFMYSAVGTSSGMPAGCCSSAVSCCSAARRSSSLST